MRRRGILLILHLIILALSALLVVMISIDTFRNIDFYEQAHFEKAQYWICLVFVADFFVEMMLSTNKWSYIWKNLAFLLVSIPYQAIFYHFGWHVSEQTAYLMRYIPLIRGGYAMAIVVGWLTANKATGLFFSYIITLLSTVYFASLTFYLFEKGVNPLVLKYQDALWWASMDVTTVGCNVVAVTGVGRVLSVLLAALGMMMFPIFTVYVTNLLRKRNDTQQSFAEAYKAYLAEKKTNPATQPDPSDPS